MNFYCFTDDLDKAENNYEKAKTELDQTLEELKSM